MAVSGVMKFISKNIGVHWTDSRSVLCVFGLEWHLAGGCSRGRHGATNCANSVGEPVVHRVAR